MKASRFIAHIGARICLALGSVCLPLAVHAASVSVKYVRVAADSVTTRVVLELSESIKQRIFLLDKPDRVVIDLPSARLNTALPAGEGVIKTLRAAVRDNGSLRIVLDVDAAVEPRVRWLEATADAGPRLVLDLAKPGSANDAVTAQPAGMSKEIPAATTLAATNAGQPAQANNAEPVPLRSLVTGVNSRDLIIAVDAGHGGEDPGATGNHGVKEKMSPWQSHGN